MSVISGKAGDVSPTKRAAVEKAFQKKPIGPTTITEKKEHSIQECKEIVGNERYQLLYEMVSNSYKNGQYNQSNELKELRKYGSRSEKMALTLIEQIKYYEQV